MRDRQGTDGADRLLARAVVQDGDEKAFLGLYRRHTPRLLGFVHRLLGPMGDEAEDVVQETWIRACEGLHGFRWDSIFSTWLCGIGLNVVRDRQARTARCRSLEGGAFQDPPPAPRADAEHIDLERSIGLLPDGYRMVLLLHDVEGMTHEEIAQRLGVSAGTSKSQLFHARRMLRTTLDGSKEAGNE